MIISSSGHRRVNERLLEYWHDLKGDMNFPMESAVDPDAIKDIWDCCFMVRYDSDDEAQPFRYIYLGQSLVEAYGDDANDKEICEKLAYPQSHELIERFMTVIKTQQFVNMDSEFTNSKGMLVKYRSCMLPLAKEIPDVVGYIIGGMKWKVT